MSGWSDSELATIGTADEIHIAPDRADHTSGPAAGIAAPGATAADRSVPEASTMRSGSQWPIQASGRRSTRPTAPSMAGTAASSGR
jgi:hypothetical protein